MPGFQDFSTPGRKTGEPQSMIVGKINDIHQPRNKLP